MSQIQNVEAAEKWVESVDRVVATASALKANLKAFSEGGASAEGNWQAIEPPAQQRLDVDEPSGPRAMPQLGSGSHASAE